MYSLYYAPGAASMVVHWLLIELGVPHELRLVDTKSGQQKSAEYLALNPNGVVPTLIDEGVPRFECAALAMLLADRHPQAGFAPAADSPLRAQ
jgi:glutathione S-transferase